MTQPTERRFVMEPRLDAEVQALEAVDATKAPLASPALTGTPTAPTAAVDTSTTQLATTAFVTNQAAAATSPMNGTAAVGTSKRYARQDHVHPTDTTRAPVASPTFTGTVTTPLTTAGIVTTTAGGVIGSTATVPLANGGANAALTATNGGVVYSGASSLAVSTAGTANQVLKSNGAAAPTWQTLDLTYMPDAAYKKSVSCATTTDLGASLQTATTLTGYSASVTLACTTTAGSTSVTTTSTSGIKVGAAITINAAFTAAVTVTAINSATTFTVSSGTGVVAGTGVSTVFTNTIAALTLDGITPVLNDRILVKNQTTVGGLSVTANRDNGIYYLSTVGSASVPWVLTRTTDADTISEIAGATVNVDSGTQGAQLWTNNLKTTDTLGTTAMAWYRVVDTSYTIPASQGGTGQTSYAVGDLLYAPTTTTVGKLADVATGNALISGGVGVAPSYGKIGLTTHVSGTLPLANGGTNGTPTAVNGGIVYSNATGMAISAAGTSGQVLKSNGAAAPTWQTNSLDSLSNVVITSPTAGQTLAYNGTNWINGSGGGGGVTASATAPASPVNGSAWFDTNDGTLYVYYTDANSSQWVEVQADSALGSQLATRMSTAESNITALQSASPNYLLNADFSINQRGFTSSTTNGVYGFDRWHMAALSGATYSAQTFTPGAAPVAGYEGKNYARLVTAGQTGANMYTILRQMIEDVRLLAGKTVTISFWARAASGTPRVAVELEQAFGSGGSPSAAVTVNAGQVTLSTSWNRYSVTVAVPSLAGKTLGTNENTSLTYLSLFVSAGTDYNARTGSLGIQSNTFDFWGVQVEHGAVATGFRRNQENIQAELAACQRYYYRFVTTQGYGTFTTGVARASTTVYGVIPMPVTMRTAPSSIDMNGTASQYMVIGSNTVACSALPTISTASPHAVELIFTTAGSLTAGQAYMFGNTNAANIYIGFNAEL